ncbi:MAG: YfbK domain-containing protein [Anaerolineales bacterium]
MIAMDAKIQVDFNPDVVAYYRLIGYENRDVTDQDFRNNAEDAG